MKKLRILCEIPAVVEVVAEAELQEAVAEDLLQENLQWD